MKILILHPGTVPPLKEKISCFSDVWTYYIVNEMKKYVDLTVIGIPKFNDESDQESWFVGLELAGYDALITLGLRYFSTVPRKIGNILKNKIRPRGFICQIHDGSRLDNDPVDITFTLKDDSYRYPIGSDANRYVRHHAQNVYVGWAADPEINFPCQDPEHLSILVDHTNYGPNPMDKTIDILNDIKGFIDSRIWETRWKSVKVRRFDSGQVVDVDFNDDFSTVKRYDRTAIPYTEISQEHGRAHVFCVTHPESVGLVVLETAMAGALSLVPHGFLPADRLNTVNHLVYRDKIDWQETLARIDPKKCREIALANTWEKIAKIIRDTISIRQRIRNIDNLE